MFRAEIGGTEREIPDLAALQQWVDKRLITPTTPVWVEADGSPIEAQFIPGLTISITMPPSSSESEIRERRPAPPSLPNYLPWAIASMIFCCLPLGVVATIYAFRVNSLNRQQNYEEAEAFAKRTRLWLSWTAITGGTIILTFLVLYTLALYAAGYRP